MFGYRRIQILSQHPRFSSPQLESTSVRQITSRHAVSGTGRTGRHGVVPARPRPSAMAVSLDQEREERGQRRKTIIDRPRCPAMLGCKIRTGTELGNVLTDDLACDVIE